MHANRLACVVGVCHCFAVAVGICNVAVTNKLTMAVISVTNRRRTHIVFDHRVTASCYHALGQCRWIDPSKLRNYNLAAITIYDYLRSLRFFPKTSRSSYITKSQIPLRYLVRNWFEAGRRPVSDQIPLRCSARQQVAEQLAAKFY